MRSANTTRQLVCFLAIACAFAGAAACGFAWKQWGLLGAVVAIVIVWVAEAALLAVSYQLYRVTSSAETTVHRSDTVVDYSHFVAATQDTSTAAFPAQSELPASKHQVAS